MSFLESLRSACVAKRFVSFTKLPYGVYRISFCLMEETKFGHRLRVELWDDDRFVYMPERVSKHLNEEFIQQMNEQAEAADGLYFLYKGRDPTQNSWYSFQFFFS